MRQVARQASSEDAGGVSTSPINIATTNTGAPSSTQAQANTATLDSTSTADTGAGSSVSGANSAATTTGSGTNTATETTAVSTAPPTSQVTEPATTASGGASKTTDPTTNTDLSQATETNVSSDLDTTQNTSDTQLSSNTLTDLTSASLSISGSSIESSATTTGSQTSATSLHTSVFPSSTSSIPSSTAESTSSIQSSSTTTTTLSTTESSSTDTSRTSAVADTASTSLTTSFTEIISTNNGQVTTIFSPVATLNSDTSSTSTTNHRTAIIAGGAVAGVVLILICLAVVFLCKRQQKRALARSHRSLPTPRSVMLSGEDNFDLAGPKYPQRGFGIFGSRRRNNDANEYRDIASESGRHLDAPEMHELPNEPPPRLLRPVASKTGSYFQESVWPPPDEGSRLSDPLMAASNVDLHSIVDEVMGAHTHFGRSSVEASSTSSLPRPSKLRDVAAECVSPSSEAETSSEFVPRVPRHGDSPSLSSIGSSPRDSPRHWRDYSTSSEVGLLANMEGNLRGPKRSSGGNGIGSGPGAAPPSSYGRVSSPTSPLRLVTEPLQTYTASPPSARVRAKVSEAAQERRSSLTVSNPGPEAYGDDVSRAWRTLRGDAASSVLAPSFSVSTTSTQGLRRLAGGLESGAETPYPDESLIDARSLPPSLAHAWLLDVDEDMPHSVPNSNMGAGQKPRDEIPPRYDMIRRDTSTSEGGDAGAGAGADPIPGRSSSARALQQHDTN